MKTARGDNEDETNKESAVRGRYLADRYDWLCAELCQHILIYVELHKNGRVWGVIPGGDNTNDAK